MLKHCLLMQEEEPMEIESPRRREPHEKSQNKAPPDKHQTDKHLSGRREKSASVERHVLTDKPRRAGSADTVATSERKAHSLAKQKIQMELENGRVIEDRETKKG